MSLGSRQGGDLFVCHKMLSDTYICGEIRNEKVNSYRVSCAKLCVCMCVLISNRQIK